MATHQEMFGQQKPEDKISKKQVAEIILVALASTGVLGLWMGINASQNNLNQDPNFGKLPALTAPPEECNAFLVSGPMGDEFVNAKGEKVDPSGQLGIHVNPNRTEEIRFLNQDFVGQCVTTIK